MKRSGRSGEVSEVSEVLILVLAGGWRRRGRNGRGTGIGRIRTHQQGSGNILPRQIPERVGLGEGFSRRSGAGERSRNRNRQRRRQADGIGGGTARRHGGGGGRFAPVTVTVTVTVTVAVTVCGFEVPEITKVLFASVFSARSFLAGRLRSGSGVEERSGDAGRGRGGGRSLERSLERWAVAGCGGGGGSGGRGRGGRGEVGEGGSGRERRRGTGTVAGTSYLGRTGHVGGTCPVVSAGAGVGRGKGRKGRKGRKGGDGCVLKVPELLSVGGDEVVERRQVASDPRPAGGGRKREGRRLEAEGELERGGGSER